MGQCKIIGGGSVKVSIRGALLNLQPGYLKQRHQFILFPLDGTER